MRKVLFTFAFVVSGPIAAMAFPEPTPAPAADDADQAVQELFEQDTELTAEAIDVNATTPTQVEAAPAEVPQTPAVQPQQVQQQQQVEPQQVEPRQPVMYQQPQQQRYYYYQQQPKQGFFSRMMELERRKNRFLLRMIGINRN